MKYTHAKPVTVGLADLNAAKVDERLDEAFGPESLGIIVVEGLPDKFKALRDKVLRSAKELASLPADKLAKLEVPEAYWLVGWSCGKEKLASGLPDKYKGSFYVNCNFYQDSSAEAPKPAVCEKYKDLKGYITPNQWPSKTDLPSFEQDLKELISLMIDVAGDVARACDRRVSELSSLETKLEEYVRNSDTTKARLLHYFARAEDDKDDTADDNDDGWCGTHLDHSCLTALTSALFLDAANEAVQDPDPHSGLYIKSRTGETVKVAIPPGALAFQTGSALEVLTNGKFRAVPHFVRASASKGVSRSTLAVFCQPSLQDPVGDGDFGAYAQSIVKKNH
jgi:isopenicillin N synthase-like dioxygenase